MPGIFVRTEGVAGFLGAEDPGIVGYFAAGIGPFVVIGGLPGGGNADGLVVKNEVLFVFDEIQDMGVGASEFFFRGLAEGVVPDDPVSHCEIELASDDADIGGIIVANGDPEGAVLGQDMVTGPHPVPGPGDVVVVIDVVVIPVVLIANIEGGIGEDEVHKGGLVALL